MDIEHIIDETYVINMDKETNHLRIFDSIMTSEHNSEITWKYVRMPAINGNDLYNNITTIYRTDDNGILLNNCISTLQPVGLSELKQKYVKDINWLSPGEIGCLLSHVFLWERVANDPTLNRIAIFEDDAHSHTDVLTIHKLLYDLYKYFESTGIVEPDMLYLGKALDDCMSYERVWKNVYKSQHPLCLHAYIITKQGAQKLLGKAPYDAPIDMVPIYEIAQKSLQVMTFHPSLYFQDIINNVSSLRKLGNALNITTECLVDQQHISDNDLKFIYGLLVAFIAVLVLYIIFMWNT